jgi:hypothetical protein
LSGLMAVRYGPYRDVLYFGGRSHEAKGCRVGRHCNTACSSTRRRRCLTSSASFKGQVLTSKPGCTMSTLLLLQPPALTCEGYSCTAGRLKEPLPTLGANSSVNDATCCDVSTACSVLSNAELCLEPLQCCTLLI